MSEIEGEVREIGASHRVQRLGLSHLSLEVGHLYLEDLVAGPERLDALFAGVAPWVETAEKALFAKVRTPRVSTCFLIDDYFTPVATPSEVMPQILEAANGAGVEIDYLVRESACARTDSPGGSVSPAELLLAGLVEEPEPGTTGWRPAASSSGWLSNGRRSPASPEKQAALAVRSWAPPSQTAARRHSIFVDVQLWDDDNGRRTWSCALLAATWQLLRLGLMRNFGEPVVEPQPRPQRWPDSWSELTAVTTLTARPRDFSAYATCSILSSRFLPVEVAVRTILAQVAPDPAITAQIAERAAGEGIPLPADPLDRIEYIFAGAPAVDPPD
jgi:hypothetical protein